MTEYLLDPLRLKNSLLAAAGSHAGGPALFRLPGTPKPAGDGPCVSAYAGPGAKAFYLRLSGEQVKALAAAARLHRLDSGPLLHAFCTAHGVPLLPFPDHRSPPAPALSPSPIPVDTSPFALPVLPPCPYFGEVDYASPLPCDSSHDIHWCRHPSADKTRCWKADDVETVSGDVASCGTCRIRPGVPPFARVAVINLPSRPDRLRQFAASGFPWPVTVYPAVDGRKTGKPRYFKASAGAWGCLRSHIRVLEDAVDLDGDLLVIEDDAKCRPDFLERFKRFWGALPNDWGMAMLGGMLCGQAPKRVSADVVRLRGALATHAYAVRKDRIPEILALWYACTDHCDIMLSRIHAAVPSYAPTEWLVDQSGSRSDISG